MFYIFFSFKKESVYDASSVLHMAHDRSNI